ncbi:hypothetical protein D9M72_420680 [compost metagenome]
MQLRRQAAGGIGHHDVDAARLGRVHRVEDHRGRVAAFLRHHGDVVALAPDRQLLARGGTEGVAGGQQHLLVIALEVLAQLADAGGLAGAVDARDHHHHWLLAAQRHGLFQRAQQLGQQLAQCRLDAFSGLDALGLDALAQLAQQVLGGFDAGIGHQQRGFQFLEQGLVDLDADEQRADVAAGLGQAGTQPVHPSLPGFGAGGRRGDQFKRFDGGGLRRGHGGRRRGRHLCGDRGRSRDRNRRGGRGRRGCRGGRGRL